MDEARPSPAPVGANELHVNDFFDALRILKGLEADAVSPAGKGDPIVGARIKELRGYVDVFLKSEGPRRPLLRSLDPSPEPGAPLKVEIVFRDAVQFYSGLAMSLSKGGLFVKTDVQFPMDTQLDLSCKLEKEVVDFSVSAKVIWVNPREAQGLPAGMGVKFNKQTAVQRQLLADFMNGEIPAEALAHLSL